MDQRWYVGRNSCVISFAIFPLPVTDPFAYLPSLRSVLSIGEYISGGTDYVRLVAQSRAK